MYRTMPGFDGTVPSKEDRLDNMLDVAERLKALGVDVTLDQLMEYEGLTSQDEDPLTEEDITIALYGLTYKPNVNDIRESPALNIAEKIASLHKGKVLGIDPNLQTLTTKTRLQFLSFENVKPLADIEVILVNHEQFNNIDFNKNSLIDTTGSNSFR